MSRTTQFIGLTNAAKEFLISINATELPSEEHTEGMFDEKIPLGTWVGPDGEKYQEVVQAEPWSSGPMIFTALKMTAKNGINLAHVFQWIQNPELKGEYDPIKGHYWV